MQLYSPESVYQLDQAAVKLDGFSEVELMRRAGNSVWKTLLQHWPELQRITILAGAGNNGGDAFVVALCAQQHQVEVQFLLQGELSRQSKTSCHFKDLWLQQGGEIEAWDGQTLSGQVIVDGLLGIGLQRELDNDWQSLIETVNAAQAPKLAIDIPSGLNGLTGMPQPIAVEAQLTVTFIGRKTGQFVADGPDYCGDLYFDDLGVSTRVVDTVTSQLDSIEACRLPASRKNNSHKNNYGNLLIIGGDRGMSGAVTLAARAALRSGAGLVTALVHPDCRHNLAAFAEIMVLGWDALESKLEQADVVVVGPGLGNSLEAQDCMQGLAGIEMPLVVDAGALQAEFLHSLDSGQLVITPHPGEAAALLDTSSAEIQANRLEACADLVEAFQATTILKGAGSLVAAPGCATRINTRGNPGMASAGMGDVLSGIVAALIGQGVAAYEAASTATYLHARCADAFCEQGDQIGLLASDIIDALPRLIKQLRSAS